MLLLHCKQSVKHSDSRKFLPREPHNDYTAEHDTTAFWLVTNFNTAIYGRSADMAGTRGVLAWLLLLLCRLKTGVGAADCDTTGNDLIIAAGIDCTLPATVVKTFGIVSIAGHVLVRAGSSGQYATLRVDREVVVASTGVLTASGQGNNRGQGPGHGVTSGTTSGSGGKSVTVHNSSTRGLGA